MTTLITGGSKCGKSSFAESLSLCLAGNGPVTYLATMRVSGEEDKQIVARHQKAREGKGFVVLERSENLGGLATADAVVLLEDVPNLLANEMFGGAGAKRALTGIRHLIAVCRHLILVTNEVGCDSMDYSPETSEFIDLLGQLNQGLAQLSDAVFEVVCGLPQVLKGELPCNLPARF